MVNIPNYNQQAGAAAPVVSQDPWDLVEGGGGIPSVKFGIRDEFNRFIPAPVGTSYSGILIEDLVKTQVIDYDTKEPKFWKDQSPVMQAVATVQLDPGTFQPEDDEDTGVRRIYFKSGALTALQTEIREKKIPKFGPGTRITITLIGFKPNKDPQKNPSNVFDVTIGPEFVAWVSPEQRGVNDLMGFGAVQGTQAQATQAAAAAGFPTQAQLAPQQQYVAPAQPAFPGQVVPAAAPAAPAAPNPVDPAQAQAAYEAIMAQQAQPAALPLVAEADVNALTALVRGGVPLDQAATLYAQQTGKGADFIEAAVKIVGPATQQ